jgi:aspartate aminotransferase-like enzyme
MEGLLVNLVEAVGPGLVLTNGVFGPPHAGRGGAPGGPRGALEFEWWKAVDLDRTADA